jgi:thiosulfate/3-mercaptopyruvate sulfurtransferase
MSTTTHGSSITSGSGDMDNRLALPGLMVTTDWLSNHLSNPALRLLDVRTAEHFAEGHLPGAVHVDLAALSTTIADVPGLLLSPTPFAEKMNQFGIHPDTAVVVYDDNWGLAAARVLWALQRYGFTQASLLTGGWDQWQTEDRAIETAVANVVLGDFAVNADETVLAEREWILAQLDNPDVVIVDTRGRQEFADGHLPGALNWDWLNAVPVDSWDALRPAQDLLAELAGIGITPDKEIVTYCRSGVRAAHTYWALRQLGYPHVRNYDGSWLEWGSGAGLPIEKN